MATRRAIHSVFLPLLAACDAGPAVAPVAMGPTPIAHTLDVSAAMRGQDMTFEVSGVSPGRRAYLFATARGQGSGPCAPAGAPCLDIVRPRQLGDAVAGPGGTVSFVATLPASVPLIDLWFQAITVDGTTPVVVRVIDDGDLDGLTSTEDCDDTVADCTDDCADVDGDGLRDCDVDTCLDGDGDGYGVGPGCLDADCDDSLDTVYPGAPDTVGDGVDQGCDGVDGCLGGLDADGDGVCDGLDLCTGDAGTGDADGDGVCTDLDDCPADPGRWDGSTGACADVAACASLSAVGGTSPRSPSANDDLFASVIDYDDPWDSLARFFLGQSIDPALALGAEVTWSWTRDGQPTPWDDRVLPWTATSAGEVWAPSVLATFLDGSTCGADLPGATVGPATGLDIQYVTVVDVTEDPAQGGDGCGAYRCYVNANTGDPGSPGQVSITWRDGGGNVLPWTDPVLRPGQLGRRAGDYTCEVTVTDGVTVLTDMSSHSFALPDGPTDVDDDGICNDEDVCPSSPVDDGDGDGTCDDVQVCEAIGGLVIAPTDPTTVDALSVLGGLEPILAAGIDVQWTSDAGASVSGPLVDASLTARDEVWSVTATSLYTGNPCGVGAAVVIANTPPTAASVSFSGSATAWDDLLCVPAGFDDVDGDPEGWRFRWEVDGVELPGVDTSVLPAGAAVRGQVATCIAEPFDGTDAGPAVSGSRTFGNARPRFLADPTFEADASDSCLQTLTAIPHVADADGDDLTLTYRWIRNDPVNGWQFIPVSTRVHPGPFTEGDELSVQITMGDGIGGTSPSPLPAAGYVVQPFADADADGVCDDLDPCFGDEGTGDTDLDGVCDDLDACLGDDATGDGDGDGVCDDVDLCAGDDATGDTDLDGVCGDLDLCDGDDSTGDSDGDGLCDDVDPCPEPADLAGVAALPDTREGDVLSCEASGLEPACGLPPVSVAVSWLVDDVAVSTGASFDTTGLVGGDTVACELTATLANGTVGSTVRSNTVTVTPSTWSLIGAEQDALAGMAVDVLGDLDGDGRAEIVIGAPNSGASGLGSSGTVYVAWGRSEGGVTALDDLEAELGGFAIYGASGGWIPEDTICFDSTGTIIIDCQPGRAGFDYSSGSAGGKLGDGFGARLVGRRDIDGDGVPDLVVSAPSALADGQYEAGRVYVISGVDLAGASTGTIAEIGTIATVSGELGTWPSRMYTGSGSNYSWNGHQAGFGLAVADLDADGLGDLLIGSPNADTGQGTDAGRTAVVYGADLSGPWNVADVGDALPGYHLQGRSFGFYAGAWGSHLRPIGDFDGDGLEDAYAQFESFGAASYVILGDGGETPTGGRYEDADGLLEIFADFNFVGSGIHPNWRTGLTSGRTMMPTRASGVGDVNADGLADLLVPWIRYEPTGNVAELSVFHGGNTLGSDIDPEGPFHGIGGFVVDGLPAEGDAQTMVVGNPGDLDGDGFDEAVVSIRIDPAPQGRLYVIWGTDTPVSRTFADLESGIGGFTIDAGDKHIQQINGGDVDGDGLSDLLWGTYRADTPASDAGRVDVWFGRDRRSQLTHRGTTGDDTLVGTLAVDLMVGGHGADLLDGQGGTDALSGGAGDDLLVVHDDTFRRVDGGAGVDTLRYLGAASLDLASFGERLRSIEVLDVSDGSHDVAITGPAVARLSDTSNTLRVTGDAGDVLEVTDSGWTLDDVFVDGVTTFRRIVRGPLVLEVQDEITSRVAPTLLTTTASVDEGVATSTPIVQVIGEDPDNGAPPMVALDVSGAPALAYDPATGWLSVADGSLLDHETQAEIPIPVVVTDADGLTVEATLVLTVADVAEAPYFLVDSAVASVDEQSAAGTLVAVLGAGDDDDDEVLTYALSSGNGDGAFDIDDTGRITVADGTLLDFETAPLRVLTVTVTDGTGLTDSASVDVEIGDLEDFETVFTMPFLVEQRSLIDQAGSLTSVTQPGLQSVSLSSDVDSDDSQLWNPVSQSPFTYHAQSSGTIDASFSAAVTDGYISAYLPVEITLSVPDSVPLGTAFDLEMGWELQDDAVLWGETPGLAFDATFDFQNIASSFAPSSGNNISNPSWTESGVPLSLTEEPRAFFGGPFSVLFPEGLEVEDPVRINEIWDLWEYTTDTITLQEAMGNLYPVLGELVPADEPNLLVVPLVTVTGINTPLSTSSLLDRLGLPYVSLYNSAASFGLGNLGYIDLGMTVYDSTYWFKTQSAWSMVVYVEDVTAVVTFEDGTTVSGSIDALPSVTLPAGADVNGDGFVDMSIDYDMDARLARWFAFGAGMDWTMDLMHVRASSWLYEIDPLTLQPTNESYLYDTSSFGPARSSQQSYSLIRSQTTDDWLLQGFDPLPPVTGALQISAP